MNFKTVIESTYKVLAITLVLAVLLPSGIKLSHAFNHHTHEVCESDDDSQTHFHESDIDCDFYKFKLNKNQFFALINNHESINNRFLKQEVNYYISFNNLQQLTRFQRGPPRLV